MGGIEQILLAVSILILLSIAITRATNNIGVPTLLLFLTVGMLAGSDGPGGIAFSDTALAQSVGCFALLLILFSGGLDTDWNHVRPVVWGGISLATTGVVMTAVSVGLFVTYVLNFPLNEGLLIGAVISSTDAAAVFSALRSKGIHLKQPLRPLLEFESGSNDPMAVILTVTMIRVITVSATSFTQIAVYLVLQMGIGTIAGFAAGKAMVWLINRLKSPYEGIYFVFALAFASFVYSGTALIDGSGFLAVYIAGIIVGNSDIVQRKSLVRFFDGFAWLSQICMFLTLGLLVNPSELAAIAIPALLIAGFLMFVARPVSVFAALGKSAYGWKEKVFVSWVGLRGAAPIILATFPLLAKVPHAGVMFNIVFFIVLTSALLQGWTISRAARRCGLEVPQEKTLRSPIEAAHVEGSDTELVDMNVPHRSAAAGRTIIELGLPRESLIALVGRNDQFAVPSGSTVLEEGDTLLVLARPKDVPEIRRILLTVEEGSPVSQS